MFLGNVIGVENQVAELTRHEITALSPPILTWMCSLTSQSEVVLNFSIVAILRATFQSSPHTMTSRLLAMI